MIYIFFNLSKKIRKRNDAYVNSFQLIDSKVKDLMLKNNKKYVGLSVCDEITYNEYKTLDFDLELKKAKCFQILEVLP